MTLARNPGDAESVSTENVIAGANVAEPTANGSQMFGDAQHHTETAATSGQACAKSPAGRVRHELSPRTRTADLLWEILALAWGCHGYWLGTGVALVPACHRQGPVLLPWADCRSGTNELIGEDPSVIIS